MGVRIVMKMLLLQVVGHANAKRIGGTVMWTLPLSPNKPSGAQKSALEASVRSDAPAMSSVTPRAKIGRPTQTVESKLKTSLKTRPRLGHPVMMEAHESANDPEDYKQFLDEFHKKVTLALTEEPKLPIASAVATESIGSVEAFENLVAQCHEERKILIIAGPEILQEEHLLDVHADFAVVPFDSVTAVEHFAGVAADIAAEHAGKAIFARTTGHDILEKIILRNPQAEWKTSSEGRVFIYDGAESNRGFLVPSFRDFFAQIRCGDPFSCDFPVEATTSHEAEEVAALSILVPFLISGSKHADFAKLHHPSGAEYYSSLASQLSSGKFEFVHKMNQGKLRDEQVNRFNKLLYK